MKTKNISKRKRYWPSATLEELRDRRNLASVDGDLTLALKLAIEIDKLKADEK